MLPKNVRCADMVGKFVTLDRGVRNGGGCCISAGTRVKITGFGRSFSIKTEVCSVCGQSAYVSGITRDMVSLCEQEPQEELKGWVHLGGDEWACPECGFVISTEGSWEKPIDKYCRDCGAHVQAGGESDAY